MLEMRGEDLNVLNILATKWGELITNVEHFTGSPSELSLPEHIVYVGEETRHGFLGHTILLGAKELVYPLTWGGPSEGVPRGADYPTMAHQADRAHAAGGTVTWAHFPFPWGELATDVALGKIDSVDLFTWGDAFAALTTEGGPPATQYGEGSLDVWYRFLNAGFRLPATAGTDKMLNIQVSGSVRTYVKVSGEFSYSAWLDGVRAGRTFVTTGPILTFTAGESQIGDTLEARAGDRVHVRADVRSHVPVDSLEIVQGGRVVAREEKKGATQLSVEADVTIDASTWLAARAYSPKIQAYQAWILGPGVPVMAHTSPIYVSVGGEPPRSPQDARRLASWTDGAIQWARSEAHYLSDGQREEALELYQRAKQVYLELAEE